VAATTVHVIGASGRSGAALCRSLQADGIAYIPIARNAAKWSAIGLGPSPAIADLNDQKALRAALARATHIASCAHARYAEAILAAAPDTARCVFLGSTRKFTRWPDAHGTGVLAGEIAFLRSGRPGVMLHPTMIYGAQGEDNVQRLAALLRRLPLVPLPRNAGLVQPIHQDDVTRALRAALDHCWQAPTSMVIAGPEAVRYEDFVRAVAKAAGLRRPIIVRVPAWLLMGIAALLEIGGAEPAVSRNEVRRLMEDKAFEIREMQHVLGVTPIPLAAGLARTFTAKRQS
jgi:uncharacterized protein YbjT (DUF2867 family)